MTREEAIQKIQNDLKLHHDYLSSDYRKSLRMAIEALQQPEIVRCKDCKHRYVDGENVRFNVCELNHNKVQSDDWFCADAERKDDETE